MSTLSTGRSKLTRGYSIAVTSAAILPSSVANLIATLEPALTAVLAYFWLGEWLTGMEILGSAMILAGGVLLRVTEGRQADQDRPRSHRAGKAVSIG